MRDQYAGDVSDVLKFALLRPLAGSDRRVGIAWYYAPGDDGRVDGQHLEWRDEPAWRQVDGQLHTGLSALSERSIAALELAPIWPKGALFHRDPVPSRVRRSEWGTHMRAVLDSADLVLLDPDNGLGAETEKHATYSEISLLRRPGRVIVFITFPGRSKPHDALLRQLHERLAVKANAENVVTRRTNVSVPCAGRPRSYVQRQRWLTIIDADTVLIERLREFAAVLASVPRVRVRMDGAR